MAVRRAGSRRTHPSVDHHRTPVGRHVYQLVVGVDLVEGRCQQTLIGDLSHRIRASHEDVIDGCAYDGFDRDVAAYLVARDE